MNKLWFLFVFILTNCSVSHQWKQQLHPSPYLPLVFDQPNLIGKGLIIKPQGNQAVSCLKHFESRTNRGHLEIEFARIKKGHTEPDPRFAHFIKKNRKRAVQQNLRSQKPLLFALKITIKDRSSSIQDNTIEFRDDIKEIILEDDKERFFENCGSEYVQTIHFDTHLQFFFAIYPKSSKDSKILEKAVIQRFSTEKENTQKISLFKDLVFEGETYFSLQTETDKLFEPVEFPFSNFHKKNIDDFLNGVVQNAHNSNYGSVRSYHRVPWSKLDALRTLTPLRKAGNRLKDFDVAIYNSLQLLQSSVKLFNIRRFQTKQLLKNQGSQETKLATCSQILEKSAESINWLSYQQCHQEAVDKNRVASKNLLTCKPIIKTIDSLNRDSRCVIPHQGKLSENLLHLNDQIYQPIQLVDHQVKDPLSTNRYYSEYRFNDTEQIEEVPEPITLGQGMDQLGLKYKNCLVEDSKSYWQRQNQRVQSITNNYYPVSFEEWPFWKKVLLFWKDYPIWTLYRGSLEIIGSSATLNPNFTLTEEAEKLAKSDLIKFYNSCGTHYLNQILHRRGFVYYFSPNSPGDERIELTPFGRAQTTSPETTQDPDENSVLVSKTKNINPSEEVVRNILEPKTVESFFKTKYKLITLFEKDEKAIPLRLSLVPWSDYLVNKKIIKLDQLDLTKYIE